MSNWNPSKIFDTDKSLRLSPSEITAIQSKLPWAEDGSLYADAVFEGGGVKGLAFLGAIRCFNDVGIHWRKVAGTSAGAITASMLAAGFSVDQLESIMSQMNYQDEFLKQKTSWLVRNGSPEDDLHHFHWMLGNLMIARQKGQYSSQPFKDWLLRHLTQKNLTTFAPFLQKQQANKKWYQQRELRVVVSDISRKAMQILPGDLGSYNEAPETFSVAEAVRLSMSIPLFFEPGQLGDSTIVDGGILSNFPLWIYDADPGKKPNCPTFGFRLVEPEKPAKPIKGALDIVLSMLETMQTAWDRHHLRDNEHGRVIKIGTLGISTTQFNLSDEDKAALYKEGYKQTKEFLLNQWSWKEHLKSRGFSDEGNQDPIQEPPQAA